MSLSNHFYVVVRDVAYMYSQETFETGLKLAKERKISFKFDGLCVNCTTFNDLENLYRLFFTDENRFLRGVYDSGYQFRDLGSRIYFKVNGMTVQIWAYAAENSGKLTEGAGGSRVYIPVYCSFFSVNDIVFDSIHVSSVFY